MHTTHHKLQKIANLAHLDLDSDPDIAMQLANDVNAIMNFVDQLKGVDTKDAAPLIHPLDGHQPLRADQVDNHNYAEELASISPLFADDLYLVPTVINTGN